MTDYDITSVIRNGRTGVLHSEQSEVSAANARTTIVILTGKGRPAYSKWNGKNVLQ